jgi:hypothetical protein
MRNPRWLPQILCVMSVVACVQVSTLGQTAEDKNKLAAISSAGSSVRWEMAAPYAALTMTVAAPDGRVFRKEFKAGATPEFMITDDQGEKLPDGQYSYELRLTPIFSPAVKAALAAARGKDDDPETVRAARKRAIPPSLVHSGGFSIMNGVAIVAGPTEISEPRKAIVLTEPFRLPSMTGVKTENRKQHHPLLNVDQVIPDDLIVQGSICAGLDCVNGEVFGFDTIRLKENNTRLQFDDTSAAGFPTNNWQIRANSSAAGGVSFLGFVDQGATGNSETGTIVFEVDAGAPANSLRVASTGKMGLRTATPVLDVHMNTSDTPAIRLEQNNSGGFTAQTWDIAGNEANFFVRDVTSGSRLPFRIRPGAPTSSIDVSASGKVGLGTASPNARLDIKESEDSFVGALQLRRSTTNDTWALATAADNSLYVGYASDASLANENADFTFAMVVTNTNRVGIGTAAPSDLLSVNGTASKPGGGSWAVFSDERLKTIKGNFTSGLKAVLQLQPLRYEYKSDNALQLKSPGEHVGFGALAVQKVIPEAVTTSDSGYLQVNNDPILWTMLNAIKEQQQQIEQLRKEVRQLRRTSRRQR